MFSADNIMFYTSDLTDSLYPCRWCLPDEEASAKFQGREDYSVSPCSVICIIKVLLHMSVILAPIRFYSSSTVF